MHLECLFKLLYIVNLYLMTETQTESIFFTMSPSSQADASTPKWQYIIRYPLGYYFDELTWPLIIILLTYCKLDIVYDKSY